jgi:SAM-dependent methyltransferase
MDRNYWEKIAPDYNEEIFDVLHHDKSGIIVSAIRKLKSKKRSVIDIGCAVGKWIPALSPLFKNVLAIDISEKNLEIAKSTHSQFKNVEYSRVDMSDPQSKIQACDVGICINAILTGSLEKRIIFFRSLTKCIKKAGHLILVVPSLESAMYTSIIRDRWNIDKNTEEKVSTGIALQKWNHIKQGNAFIDGVATKHYLKEELQLLLSQEGFDVIQTEKVEYDWKTEFLKPPKWLKEPFPWDWMVVAKKK